VTPAPAGAIVLPVMPAHRISFAPTGLTRVRAKALARRAYDRARAAGSLSSVVVDRLWSDTLAVEHQPAATATEMLVRAQHLFVLIEDRARWPR
jgi:hypothetical protein